MFVILHMRWFLMQSPFPLQCIFLHLSFLHGQWMLESGPWDPLVRYYYLAHNNGCCTIYRISCALKQKSERTPLNSFFPLQTFCGKVLRAFRDDGSAARPRLDTSLSQSIPLQVTVFDVALKVLYSLPCLWGFIKDNVEDWGTNMRRNLTLLSYNQLFNMP